MPPTRAQIESLLGSKFRVLNELKLYAQTNTQRFTGAAPSHESQVISALINEFSYHREMVSSLEAFRARLSEIASPGQAAALIAGGLREYGRFIGAPETDIASIMSRLRDDFIANAKTVKSRNFTFGAPAAGGGNAGNALVNRLTVDEDDLKIESTTADVKTIRCTRDEFSGAARHEEQWEIYGEDPSRDNLQFSGSGKRGQIASLSARDSLNFISNPSFSSVSGSDGAPTAITNWTAININFADITIDRVTYYRDYEGDSNPGALKITAVSSPFQGVEIEQMFSTKRIALQPRTPIHIQVAVHKGTATAGTFQVYFGSVASPVLNLADLSAGWNIIRLNGINTVGGIDENWYKKIKTNVAADQRIAIEVTGMTAGQFIRIDDVVIAPFTQFDGLWYAIVGGSNKSLVEDKYTMTDTEVGAIVQFWLWWATGMTLPHSGSPTWLDPT